MVCTYCGSSTRVSNSRHQKKSNQVWRRRRCDSCGATFSSEELVRYELAWVVWQDGRFEPFSRDKLFLSLYACCDHRQSALSDTQGLTETVIRKLPAYIIEDTTGTITNRTIAQVTQVALNRFDQAASTRYHSLYPYLH